MPTVDSNKNLGLTEEQSNETENDKKVGKTTKRNRETTQENLLTLRGYIHTE